MSYPYIIQGSNLVVVIDNKPHTVSKSQPFYEKIIEAVKTNDWETVKDLIEPKQAIVNYSNGNVTVKENTFYWKGEVMHNSMTSRMVNMLSEGFDVSPMVAFMENLMQNPSNRAVNELYGFLEKNNLPITPDGYFLAYKKVRGDFKDVYSGTMDNSPGQVVEMQRNQVDDDRNRTCSNGLHFCSLDYLSHFGGEKIVIVKINPMDVVSIPSDYNDSKGRTCRYEVLSELTVDPRKAFVRTVQEDFYEDDDFEEDDDWIDEYEENDDEWLNHDTDSAGKNY